MTSHRIRGMTMLEVLAATVLLTILVTMCVPLLQRAMRTMHDCLLSRQGSSEKAIELAAIAQAALDHPDKFGAKSIEDLDSKSIVWPNSRSNEVHVDVLLASSTTSDGHNNPDDPPVSGRVDGMWLKFTCEGTVLYRWAPMPQKPNTRRRSAMGDGR